jgi:putative acetyltransferase
MSRQGEPQHPAAGSGSDPSIRPERNDDEEQIGLVIEAAFGAPAVAVLVTAIRDSPEFIPELSLVAEVGGRVVGHVMISGATLRDDGVAHKVTTLSPLAVLPDLQRKGIGSALVREVTARADDRGEPVVVLEGDPAFYGRFGFEHSVPHGVHIELPGWAPPEAAQLLRLTAYRPSLRGRVVYPPAFDPVIEH